MRQRRGLSPRTVQAVSALTPQDIDDLLVTMPFLAPILPVPAAHGGNQSLARTPRRSSNKLKTTTPRGSMMLSARISDPGNITPTPKRQGATAAPLDVYRLTLAEVELATKAWVQILATSNAAAPGAEGGGGVKGNNVAPTQATLFARACTEVAYLRSGRQLRDILQLIHIPVLPLISDLLDHVVELAGSANQTASTEASLHFFRFLQFLSECRHLDALQRHRQLLSSSPKYNRNSTMLGGDINGSPTRTHMDVVEADNEAGLEASTTEALQMEDIRATYEYLKEECAHQLLEEGQNAEANGREGDGVAVSPQATLATTTITATTVAGFAHRFDLSLLAVLPREYLIIPPTPRAQSTSLGDTARGRRSSLDTPDLALSLRRGNGSIGSVANLTGFGGLPSISKAVASPTPASRPPPTLLPSMAGVEVTLDHFAEHVRSQCNDVAPLEFHHDETDASLTAFGIDGLGDASLRNGTLNSDASVHSGMHQRSATLLPLKLGAHALSPTPLPDATDHNRTQASSTTHPSPHGGAGGTDWLAQGHLTSMTLRPYATWLESHSPLSTLQVPPRSYTSLAEGKERHKREERARRERERRLRDEYLYGPARPKPKTKSAEEESIGLLHEATDLVEALDDEDIFAVEKMTHQIHSVQCARLMEERREANRYACILGTSTSDRRAGSGGAGPVVMKSQVRHATAQEILAMLQRCPQDSVLGTQAKARLAQRQLGMNGLAPRRTQSRHNH